MKYSFEDYSLEEFPDYYDILGIDDMDASKDDIHEMYLKLINSFHPDKNKSRYADKRTKLINEAYEVLSDEKARKKYDSLLIKYFKNDQNDVDTSIEVRSKEAIDWYISTLCNFGENINELMELGYKGTMEKYGKTLNRIYALNKTLRYFTRSKSLVDDETLVEVCDLLSLFRTDANALDQNSKENQEIIELLDDVTEDIYRSLSYEYQLVINKMCKNSNNKYKKYKVLNWMNENIWPWIISAGIPLVVAIIIALVVEHII